MEGELAGLEAGRVSELLTRSLDFNRSSMIADSREGGRLMSSSSEPCGIVYGALLNMPLN